MIGESNLGGYTMEDNTVLTVMTFAWFTLTVFTTAIIFFNILLASI